MGEVTSRLVSFALLLALFAGMLGVHELVPAGAGRIAAIYLLALLQVILVVFGFMRLRGAETLVKVTVLATLVWLAILFGFMTLDFFHR